MTLLTTPSFHARIEFAHLQAASGAMLIMRRSARESRRVVRGQRALSGVRRGALRRGPDEAAVGAGQFVSTRREREARGRSGDLHGGELRGVLAAERAGSR